MIDLDPIIHEASRLKIIAILNECEVGDFNFLLSTTGLSRGNLSSHMSKMVRAGYIDEKKEFIDKKPHTEYRLNKVGHKAYKRYLRDWKNFTKSENIRKTFKNSTE